MSKKKFTLVCVDGNAFGVMGYVINAMKKTGHTQGEINNYRADATSSDYNHLLSVSIEMIENCNQKMS